QSTPSHFRPSRIPSTSSGLFRSASVSSIRRIIVPPCRRTKSQLNSAVRAPPTCRYPVGDGANLTLAVLFAFPPKPLLIEPSFNSSRNVQFSEYAGTRPTCPLPQRRLASVANWLPPACVLLWPPVPRYACFRKNP